MQNLLRLVRGQRGETGHHGRAVDERETFLGAQHGGSQARLAKRLARRQSLAADPRVAQADEQPAHVRERHEIAAGPDRTFAGNLREDALVQRRDEQLDQFLANPRVTARERVGAGDHDGARLGVREQRALTDEQVVQQIDLVLRLIFVRDAESTQRTEPGVDAVDRARLGGEGFDQFAAASDERSRGVGERAGIAQSGDAPGIQYRQVVSVERNHQLSQKGTVYGKESVEARSGLALMTFGNPSRPTEMENPR